MNDNTHDLSSASSTGRHPVETGYLVMGIAFLSFTAVWGGYQLGWWDSHSMRFLMPVPWVLGGAIGLIALAISSRRRTEALRRDQVRARTAAAAAAEEELQRREQAAATAFPEQTLDPEVSETTPLTLGGTEPDVTPGANPGSGKDES